MLTLIWGPLVVTVVSVTVDDAEADTGIPISTDANSKPKIASFLFMNNLLVTTKSRKHHAANHGPKYW